MGKQSPIILVIKDKEIRDQLAKINAAVLGADIEILSMVHRMS